MSKRDDLLRSYEAGNFLEAVYACVLGDCADPNSLALDLVSLHNEGLIDIVGAFKLLSSNSPNGPDFFLTRGVFEEALPDLDAKVPPVLRCVVQLYREAGQDLAAAMSEPGLRKCSDVPVSHIRCMGIIHVLFIPTATS